MDSKITHYFVLIIFWCSFQAKAQFLTKHELEILDTCQLCSEWTKEEGIAFDTLRVMRYYDNKHILRRVEGINDLGDLVSVDTYEEDGRMGPLSYFLYSNGNVHSYGINNFCLESAYMFYPNGKIQEIWFQPKYADVVFIYFYSDKGYLQFKQEFDRWNDTVRYWWIYDRNGQLREEGFKKDGEPFGLWKYHNRRGKLKRTADFGPKE
jgi:antitoxin component YwqK of YwqJK toxin-antitoxin module